MASVVQLAVRGNDMDSFAVDMLACSVKSMILLFTPVHTKLSSISFTMPKFLGS